MKGVKAIAYGPRHHKIHAKFFSIDDLELEAVVFALKTWRQYMYGVHVNVFNDHKSLQFVFTQQESNLFHRRWLQFVKDYNMIKHYHPVKANVLVDALSRLCMGSVAHVERKGIS